MIHSIRMNKRFILIFVALTSLFMLTGCFSRPRTSGHEHTLNLKGRVTDESSENGIEGVHIQILDDKKRSIRTVPTNESGYWEDTIKAEGTVTIIPEKDGFSFDPEYHEAPESRNDLDFTAKLSSQTPPDDEDENENDNDENGDGNQDENETDDEDDSDDDEGSDGQTDDDDKDANEDGSKDDDGDSGDNGDEDGDNDTGEGDQDEDSGSNDGNHNDDEDDNDDDEGDNNGHIAVSGVIINGHRGFDMYVYPDPKPIQLRATVFPKDASNKAVRWTSSKPHIATVDANGLVTPIAAGTTTITVTTEEGNFADSRFVHVLVKTD